MSLLARRRLNSKNMLSEPFKFTINTSLQAGTTFTLPLPSDSAAFYDFHWTPYDGATPIHVTSSADTNKVYDYGVDGIYTVSVGTSSGDVCEGWSFDLSGNCQMLTSVDSWGNLGFTDIEGAFSGCVNMITMDAGVLLLDKVTSLKDFIFGCTKLTYIDVSEWDVSTITSLDSFAMSCTVLRNIDVSNWNVSSVSNTNRMFQNCLFDTIDTSNWDTQSLVDCGAMFRNCQLLQTFDTSNWDTSNVTTCAAMCYFNFALTSYFDPAKWWNNVNITSFSLAFRNATNVPNYASIPASWK